MHQLTSVSFDQSDDHVCSLSAGKKLGGKLDVVSYHDEVEGGLQPYVIVFCCTDYKGGRCLILSVLNHICVSV